MDTFVKICNSTVNPHKWGKQEFVTFIMNNSE